MDRIRNREMDAATDLLIDLAYYGRPEKVQKEAIFWLGETKDPQAIDAFVEMVRKM